MIKDPSICSKTFVYDLHWNTPELTAIEERYNTNRREMILPAFLYSLTRERADYSMPLFFKAQEETDKIIDDILSMDGMEHVHFEMKDEMRLDFFRDIQLLGSKLSFKTRELQKIIDHPRQLKGVKLIGRSLYVTIVQ